MESTAPAYCEIARLPDDLLSATLARTGPREACRAAAVSPAFRAAADADVVWSSFLPRDLPPVADGELELPADPLPTKKQLFMRLSDPGSPVLLADGLMSMWLDRATGARCYMLSARKLGIAWGDTPQYWRWIPINLYRFSEAAELLYVWWLEIRGNIHSKMLSQHTTYSAYIVFRVTEERRGLHSPCLETSVSLEGNSSRSTRRVCLNDGHDRVDTWPSMRGDIPQQDALFPRERGDGWMEVEVGEFRNGEGDDGEVSISLMETSVAKRGLVVLGIEIRPKEQVV
ncbi:F-box protein PP2-B11-like [Miscanthus floridulus]|uniref:F-box protein PP2-B11-like n=1 Tax=Miscanthus floridulus TaxID=154761 RepID=UPI003459E47F